MIVEVERGQDFGVVSAVGAVAEKKCERCGACGPQAAQPSPPAPAPQAEAEGGSDGPSIRNIVRVATPDDRKTAADLRINEEEVRRTVRDLAGLFRTRIELRQIGARDEAKRLDGIGRCGRQLCISSWLPEGRPVSLSLAKAQGLSLNPVQISGPCGRLLCCLHYEHDFYVQQRKRFPKEGKTVKTSTGNERVIAVDIFRERVTLRSDDGATRVVALDELHQ